MIVRGARSIKAFGQGGGSSSGGSGDLGTPAMIYVSDPPTESAARGTYGVTPDGQIYQNSTASGSGTTWTLINGNNVANAGAPAVGGIFGAVGTGNSSTIVASIDPALFVKDKNGLLTGATSYSAGEWNVGDIIEVELMLTQVGAVAGFITTEMRDSGGTTMVPAMSSVSRVSADSNKWIRYIAIAYLQTTNLKWYGQVIGSVNGTMACNGSLGVNNTMATRTNAMEFRVNTGDVAVTLSRIAGTWKVYRQMSISSPA